MPKHELDLLGNAIDSLNEALSKFEQAKSGDAKAHKFVVLHFAHFVELILKHVVVQAHPLLIYRDPFRKDLKDAQTIGLWDAVNFLENDKKNIAPQLRIDLEWLKDLRNDIEHFKFSMDLDEVKVTLGRMMNAVAVFDETHGKINLEDRIDSGVLAVFAELANTYRSRLKLALKLVADSKDEAFRGLRPKEWGSVDWDTLSCPDCGHETMIPNGEAKSGYKCTFCANEDSEDLEVHCGLCSDRWPNGDMWYTDWADDGVYIYVCPGCVSKLGLDKD